MSSPPDDRSRDPDLDPQAKSETQVDVFQAQHNPAAPSWQRLSGKIVFRLRSFFGRVRLPPPLDFDDFTSEVMLAILRDIATFQDRGHGAFWAWVQRLAHNRLNDLWRHHDAQCRGGGQQNGTGSASDEVDLLASVPDANAQPASEMFALRELEQAEWD
jgi:DNA-directed RNA polymerase specialized sigma24 family protein